MDGFEKITPASPTKKL